MNEGNGPSPEGDSQGIVVGMVVFAVAAAVTGFDKLSFLPSVGMTVVTFNQTWD